jgi:DNA-binding SARP family transcriptional activator
VQAELNGHSASVALLGGFDLAVDGSPVAVGSGSERLLAFVALHCRTAVPRSLVAGTLWPEAPERNANASLRSALSRLPVPSRRVLDVSPSEIRLAPGAAVDLHRARQLAHRLLASDSEQPTLEVSIVEEFRLDLLPGWYDEWAVPAAEEWRQLRLRALESLAENLLSAGRPGEAVVVCAAAAHAEPLRETSCALVIRSLLAEGNPSEALFTFERYEQRLRQEVGLAPTDRLLALVAGLRRTPWRPASRPASWVASS